MADPYVTPLGFKTWIGLSDYVDDITITDALTGASRAIDKFCNTHFWQTTAGTARVFDTCDPWQVRIHDAAAVTQHGKAIRNLAHFFKKVADVDDRDSFGAQLPDQRE